MSHQHYCCREGIHDHRWRCLADPCLLHDVADCLDPTSCLNGPHEQCENYGCFCECHEERPREFRVSRRIRDDDDLTRWASPL
jgi:hypothetical protein